jgi:prophage endopeptidase
VNLGAIIPVPWRIGLLALLSAFLLAFGWVRGAQHVQRNWDAAEGARAQAVTNAVLARVAANKKEAVRQAAVNETITEAKDHEIATLTARLNAAGRLRIGPALCSGPSPTAQAETTGGGYDADPPVRLVREDVDRDLKSLILAVETDLATGRACQAFAKSVDTKP